MKILTSKDLRESIRLRIGPSSEPYPGLPLEPWPNALQPVETPHYWSRYSIV
jgi:hypothetical protein